MTYKEAHEIIEGHRSVYNQYGENTVERMIYQGRDYKNAAFQYYREWEDQISTGDLAVLTRIYPYLSDHLQGGLTHAKEMENRLPVPVRRNPPHSGVSYPAGNHVARRDGA